MKWTTIDAVTPDTKTSSMVAPDKRSGWTWGNNGSPGQRQASEQATIDKEREYRRIANTIGEVVGTAAKDAVDAKLNEAQNAAQYSVRSTWGDQKQNINLTLLVFGVIAAHGAVSWLRPIINTANSLNGFNPLDLRGILQLISNNQSFGSDDKTPLKKGDRVGEWVVTSGFGNRSAPTAGASTFHRGVDLNTPVGTPLYAPVATTFDCRQEDGGYGTFADSDVLMAGHLSQCYPGFKQQGEVFALTGNTGISTGPHLDLRERRGSEFINPTRGFTERVMGVQSVPVQLASHTTNASPQIKAFLDTIAWAEGAEYNTLVGGGTFNNFSKHPDIYNPQLNSDAAGKYQFLKSTWDQYSKQLGLSDISPASQDKAAIAILEENNVPSLLESGKVDEAFCSVGKVWASFPCNNYGQPQKSTGELRQKYKEFGGTVSPQTAPSRTLDLLNRGAQRI